MKNEVYHRTAERTKTIRVEIDRVKYEPESLSLTETNTHIVEMGLDIGTIIEEEIIDKIPIILIKKYFLKFSYLQIKAI